MANKDRPRGFRPYGRILQKAVFVAGAAIYPGDLVSISSDGKVDPAAAGAVILGAALNYAAADGDKVMVSISPDQLYVAQADEADIDAQTDIGNVCDHLATAGNSTYKQSRMEIDSSLIGTGGAQGLVIMEIHPGQGNAGGAQCDVVVKINQHQLVTSFAGV